MCASRFFCLFFFECVRSKNKKEGKRHTQVFTAIHARIQDDKDRTISAFMDGHTTNDAEVKMAEKNAVNKNCLLRRI